MTVRDAIKAMPRNMRSRQLNLAAYDTDKIKHQFLDLYDPVLAPLVNKEVRLLELGIHRGGSLELWRDYFPRGVIVGIDLKVPESFVPGERIQIFEGNQVDTAFLSDVANRIAPEGFDIIIDDASHIGELTRIAFWHLFDHHLKSGGIYAIEDWGTGYLGDFPDGRQFNPKPSILERVQSLLPQRLSRMIKVPSYCHSYGMVGFIKELVDEQGAASVTLGRKAGWRSSKFKNVLITSTIVFVTKARSSLEAFPNPVPVDRGSGKTTISWEAAGTPVGNVCVAVDGQGETLFAQGHQGSVSANWIRAGHTYEFRLYDSDRKEILDKVVVTTAMQ